MGIRIALIGLGGYGEGYVKELLKPPENREVHLVAGIDPAPERCQSLPELIQVGVPIYPSLQDFFAQDRADLVILSSPIHMHATQTCLSLAYESNVLCEKPACAVIQDAHRMIDAEKLAGKLVSIGYQWSFTPAVQALKRDIMSGVFGSPKRLKTCVLWPRMASYYQRNRWAGRIKTDSGDWVMDSPANNAMAHYLHHALYVVGASTNTSIRPVSVQAELYRANPIENYDAAALRVMAEGNVEILFFGAHTVREEAHPSFSFEFENATIDYTAYSGSGITARFKNGTSRNYDDPNAPGGEWEKLWQTVDSIRTEEPVVCGIEAASAHTLCINGAQESSEIVSIPPENVRQELNGDNDSLTWVYGLREAFMRCYELNCLPADNNSLSWAKEGKVVDLLDYQLFPSGGNRNSS
jgi:predicted dehydrogenase